MKGSELSLVFGPCALQSVGSHDLHSDASVISKKPDPLCVEVVRFAIFGTSGARMRLPCVGSGVREECVDEGGPLAELDYLWENRRSYFCFGW